MADPKLVIRVMSDVRQALDGLDAVTKQAERATQQTDALGRSFTRFGGGGSGGAGAGGFVASIKGAAAALGALYAAQRSLSGVAALAALADQYNALSARIKLATGAAGDFAAAQAGVYAVAQRGGIALEDAARLYTRLSVALRGTGSGQREILAISEDVSRALRISGATGAEAASAMLQFSQALGAGVLRGEELNAILEAAPRLAQAIADGLAVPVGQLKALGEQGALTGALVAKALRSQRAILEAEAKALPDTLPLAWQRLGNAVQRAVGEIDRAAGITPAIARALSAMADSASFAGPKVDALTERVKALREEREALAGVGASKARVGNPLEALAAEYTATAAKFAEAQKRAAELIARARRPQASVGDSDAALRAERSTAQQRALLDELRAKLVRDSKDTLSPAQELANNKFEALVTKYRSSAEKLSDALKELRDNAKGAGVALNSPRFRQAEAAVRAAFAKKGGATAKPADLTDERLAVDRAGIDAGARMEEDAIARVRERYRAAFDARRIDAAEFYAADARLQQQSTDAKIAGLEKERSAAASRTTNTAGSDADRLRAAAEVQRLDSEIAIARRNRGQVEVQAAEAATRAEKELAATLADVRLQLAEGQGAATLADRRAAFARQNQALIEQLQAKGDTAGVADVNRLIDTRATGQQFQQIEQQINGVLERVRLAEERLRTEVETGLVSQFSAQKKLADVRAQAAPQVATLVGEMDKLATATGGALGPEQINNVERLRFVLEELRRTANPLKQQLQQLGESNVGDFFYSIATGAATAKEAFSNLVRGILQDLARLASQQLAKQLLSSLFSGPAPSGAPSGAGSPFIPPVTAATGGYISGPGSGTSDSIPAWLSNGEFVVRAAAVRQWGVGFLAMLNSGIAPPALRAGRLGYAGGGPVVGSPSPGAGPEVAVRVVNVLDPSIVGNFLDSAAGERVVMNVINRNRTGIRAAIA